MLGHVQLVYEQHGSYRWGSTARATSRQQRARRNSKGARDLTATARATEQQGRARRNSKGARDVTATVRATGQQGRVQLSRLLSCMPRPSISKSRQLHTQPSLGTPTSSPSLCSTQLRLAQRTMSTARYAARGERAQ